MNDGGNGSMKQFIFIIGLCMLLIGCNNQTNTTKIDPNIISFWVSQTPQRDITPHQENVLFTYNCSDVAKDCWRYPSNYDKPFNYAFEYCNGTNPSLILACQEEQDNLTINGSLFLMIGNISFLTNITSMFTIDCSAPSLNENESVDIIYNESAYNNSNRLTISFQELCARLNKQ